LAALVGTGGTAAALSKGNRAKQIAGGAIAGYDALGNGIGIGRGLNDVAENGITVNNSIQVLGGIAGATGNIGGAKGFDAPAPKEVIVTGRIMVAFLAELKV
jgi:hypothetical protein